MNLIEFEKWAIAQGSVGNPTPEGSYKGECVSLIQQYLNKVFNIPFKARGNAKDWANITIEGFNRFASDNTPKPGDILVYTWGQYGHMAIITADMKSLEQNKNGNRIVTLGSIESGYAIIQRPTKVDLGVEDNYEIGKTYITKVDLKVREGAGTNYKQKNRNELTVDGQQNAYDYTTAVLKTGTKVTLLEKKVVNDNEIWGRIPSGWIAFKYDGKTYVE